MTKLKEAMAREARVKALVKNIKPVDTSIQVRSFFLKEKMLAPTTEMCFAQEALMLEDINE